MESSIDIAKQVLKLEADSIYTLIEHIDQNFAKAVDIILQQNRRLLIMGVGKSGHIGKKIAATLASTGQPSFFIHPTEAIHGDLGMMVKGDICLLISHSGNTSEILSTIPSVKRIGLPIISITSNPKSKLAKYSDVILLTYVHEEACPFNLAPTNSTTVSLAYGDALAIALLKKRGFKEEQFATRHPGGVLGKRLLTKVSDIMISDNIPMNKKTDSFLDALAVMTKGKQGITIIADDENKCVGILTDGDIRRTIEKYNIIDQIVLGEIYTKNPKKILHDALAVEALKQMLDTETTCLVVVDNKEIVIGIIHIHHLMEQGFY